MLPFSTTRTLSRRHARWYVPGASAHARLAAAAVEAGVTVLAGADTRPHGGIAQEIRALVAAGISAHQAIAAASCSARSYLGLPGLVDGAPADAVVFDADPRADLGQLGKAASRHRPRKARASATASLRPGTFSRPAVSMMCR